MGANESTEVEFFTTVKIGNKNIAKGRYTLYCIPNADKWTVILSNDNYGWGNYSYDIKKDVARVDIKPEKNIDVTENFTMYFDDAKNGANLIILWDDVKAVLPITLVP